ncbi:DUF433 domain-containing protein [bacterium]|nr:DUF433 domain-containing protein [bacterium]
MSDNHYKYIGKGIYSIREAAHYIGVNPQRLHHWYYERADKKGRGPICHPSYDKVDNKTAINFWDMIDGYVVSFLLGKGVKMKTVRDAYQKMKKELKKDHPFCVRGILTDGVKIFCESAELLNDETLYDVMKDQMYFQEFKKKLDSIDYHKISQYAYQWNIFHGVLIHPDISFGKPVIKNTSLQTKTIYDAYIANGKNSLLIAQLYEITEVDVARAVLFEQNLPNRKAA